MILLSVLLLLEYFLIITGTADLWISLETKQGKTKYGMMICMLESYLMKYDNYIQNLMYLDICILNGTNHDEKLINVLIWIL